MCRRYSIIITSFVLSLSIKIIRSPLLRAHRNGTLRACSRAGTHAVAPVRMLLLLLGLHRSPLSLRDLLCCSSRLLLPGNEFCSLRGRILSSGLTSYDRRAPRMFPSPGFSERDRDPRSLFENTPVVSWKILRRRRWRPLPKNASAVHSSLRLLPLLLSTFLTNLS